MGNSAASSHASVHVALERGQYHAGEVVRGYVQVQVQSQFSCTDLYAIFHGDAETTVHSEETEWEGSGENRRQVTRHHVHHARERLVEDVRLVAKFMGGCAAPGLYQFPFEFALHPMLPSSAFVSGNDHAAIAYGVEVHMVRPGFFNRDLVHRTFIDLIANVPHPITPEMVHDNPTVNFCCCFNRGSVDLGAALEKNAFCANENVVVNFQMSNNSSSEVQDIRIDLKERIHLHAQGRHSHKTHTLASHVVGGVRPGASVPPNLVNLILPPAFMHCSLQTGILQIEHYVEVKGETPFCVDNPSVKLPVTVHRSPLVALQMPAMHAQDQMQRVMPVPYQLDPNAMLSPVAVPVQAAPAVAPITAQAMQMAPQQSQMTPGQPPQQPLLAS